MAMLERMKTLLGIKDDMQDDVLKIIIENAEAHLFALVGRNIPETLNFVVLEVSIMRYNRLGSEGMKSELVEGHKTDFYEPKDDFRPYLTLIESFKEQETDDTPQRGRAVFF